MLPYGIETYFNRLLYPNGGVAPLRHELATYEYIERQREYQEQAELLRVAATARAILGKTLRPLARFAQLLVTAAKEGLEASAKKSA
jgi:hypothetical protein